jgi:hypothetical protein
MSFVDPRQLLHASSISPAILPPASFSSAFHASSSATSTHTSESNRKSEHVNESSTRAYDQAQSMSKNAFPFAEMPHPTASPTQSPQPSPTLTSASSIPQMSSLHLHNASPRFASCGQLSGQTMMDQRGLFSSHTAL